MGYNRGRLERAVEGASMNQFWLEACRFSYYNENKILANRGVL
jgi:hypothetical protein